MYKVQKKDGSQEDFDKAKIVSGALNAGATQEEAEKIASEIEEWLPSVAKDNVVNSMDIRTKGLEVFKSLNPEAATKFESFQKPADN